MFETSEDSINDIRKYKKIVANIIILRKELDALRKKFDMRIFEEVKSEIENDSVTNKEIVELAKEYLE